MSRKYLFVIVLLLAFLGCGVKGKNIAVQTAMVSQNIYDVISDVWADETAAVIKKIKAGTATEEDIQYKNKLATMKPLLEKYGRAHNLYADLMDTWQKTGEKPIEISELTANLSKSLTEIVVFAQELGFNIPGIKGGT